MSASRAEMTSDELYEASASREPQWIAKSSGELNGSDTPRLRVSYVEFVSAMSTLGNVPPSTVSDPVPDWEPAVMIAY